MSRAFAGCLLVMSSLAAADPALVSNDRFAVMLPDGYHDITDALRTEGFPRPQLSLEANLITMGYRPTIMFQRAPVYGGSLGDTSLCAMAADGIASEDGGTLRAAVIVQGPVGPSCQMSIVYPQAAALITELNGASETWLMTCNHADGDHAAERTCRAVLASFHPAPAFGRPDPATQAVARVFARVLDPLAYQIRHLLRAFRIVPP